MLLNDLPESSFELLDGASGGVLSQLRARYDRVHLTVQTHHDGLPEGEMKLFITVEGETDYAIARLGGSVLMVGWDIYLRDLTQSARVHLQLVQQTIANLELEVEGKPNRGCARP